MGLVKWPYLETLIPDSVRCYFRNTEMMKVKVDRGGILMLNTKTSEAFWSACNDLLSRCPIFRTKWCKTFRTYFKLYLNLQQWHFVLNYDIILPTIVNILLHLLKLFLESKICERRIWGKERSWDKRLQFSRLDFGYIH